MPSSSPTTSSSQLLSSVTSSSSASLVSSTNHLDLGDIVNNSSQHDCSTNCFQTEPQTIPSRMNRKRNKPWIEKRRRARINESLRQLQEIITEDNTRKRNKTNRLEKADILEMTVSYIRRMAIARSTQTDNGNGASKQQTDYQSGFLQCIQEVCSFIKKQENHLRSKDGDELMGHCQSLVFTPRNNNNTSHEYKNNSHYLSGQHIHKKRKLNEEIQDVSSKPCACHTNFPDSTNINIVLPTHGKRSNLERKCSITEEEEESSNKRISSNDNIRRDSLDISSQEQYHGPSFMQRAESIQPHNIISLGRQEHPQFLKEKSRKFTNPSKTTVQTPIWTTPQRAATSPSKPKLSTNLMLPTTHTLNTESAYSEGIQNQIQPTPSVEGHVWILIHQDSKSTSNLPFIFQHANDSNEAQKNNQSTMVNYDRQRLATSDKTVRCTSDKLNGESIDTSLSPANDHALSTYQRSQCSRPINSYNTITPTTNEGMKNTASLDLKIYKSATGSTSTQLDPPSHEKRKNKSLVPSTLPQPSRTNQNRLNSSTPWKENIERIVGNNTHVNSPKINPNVMECTPIHPENVDFNNYTSNLWRPWY